MSVQTEIDRISQNVASTYSALSEMGATLPESQNSNNLAPTVYNALNAANKTYIFEAVVSVSTSGLSFALPEGVTHSLLVEKINAGFHVVAMATLPAAAGSKAGTYALPFTHDWQGGGSAQGDLYFSTTVIDALIYIIISSDNSIKLDYYDIERQNNKVTSISPSSTDVQYPTAKAVYDAVEEAKKSATGSLQVEFALTGIDDETGIFVFSANKSVSDCIDAFENGVPVYGDLDPTGDAFVGAMVTCDDGIAVFEIANIMNTAKRYVLSGTNDGAEDIWNGMYTDGATVEDIPTDEYINGLIDAKINEIGIAEEGSY